MAMNIRSITELQSFSGPLLSTNLLDDSKYSSSSEALKDVITKWSGSNVDLDKIDFTMLSCAKDSYIEVAAQAGSTYSSYKLNLSELLDSINKLIAAVAYMKSSGITKDEADALYIPLSGNTQENSPRITGGLRITPTTNETGLYVQGPIIVGQNSTIFEVTEDRVIASNLSASNLSADSLTFKEANGEDSLTCRSIIGSNITATAGLSVGSIGESYELVASDSQVTIFDLSATRLSTNVFQADEIIALNKLLAGRNRAGEYYVNASNDSDVNGLSASVVKTPRLEIDHLSVKQTMLVGKQDAVNWNINATSSRCDVKQLSADGLSAAEIAQLTAKAACWS